MGQVKILDTGYIRTDNTGTQASISNRANSGIAITLKTAEFSPSLKRNLGMSPDLASNVPSEVNLGSLENMKFRLKCMFNKKDSDDMDDVSHVINCIRTDGYKLLWYDYSDATAENNNSSLLYRIARNSVFGDQLTEGELSEFNINSQFYTLHVHFTDIQQVDSGKSGVIRYDLKGVVLKVRSSVI